MWTSCSSFRPLHIGIFFFIFGNLVYAAEKEEKPCTVHSEDGKYYDLNPLKANKDYEFKTEGGHTFYLNVCRGVATELWGQENNDIGAFIRQDHGDFNAGLHSTTLKTSQNGLKIIMNRGSKCAVGDVEAETVVNFICDTKVYGTGQPVLTSQVPHDDDKACAFGVEWKTHFACPTGEGGGFFGFLFSLIVLIIVVLMVYLVLGTLYNRFVLNLRGFDQVPQFSIEAFKYHASEAVEWFKERMKGGYELQQQGGFSSRPGYTRTPSRPQTNPSSHQAGVDVGSGGGFVRPTPSSPRPPPPQQPHARNITTNPSSHFSREQAAAAAAAAQPNQPSPPSPPPPPQQSVQQQAPPHSQSQLQQSIQQQQQPSLETEPVTPQHQPPKKQTSGSAEERTFMLGDVDGDEEDDDDEEEDLAAAGSPKGQGAIRL